MMRETPKSFIAATVAGLVAAALFVVYAVIMDGNYRGPGSLFAYFCAALLPFEMVSFLVGWPMYVFASSFGRARWWLSVIVGLLLGGFFSFLLGMTSWVAFPAIGAVAGAAFWFTLMSIKSSNP